MATERPILFSGGMVCAILEGRKTQTRRAVTQSNSTVDGSSWDKDRFASLDFSATDIGEDTSYRKSCGCLKYVASSMDDDPTCSHRVRSRWTVGSRLWVRETWASGYQDGAWGTIYRADSVFALGKHRHEKGPHFHAKEVGPHVRWRPSIHMPRWAYRIALEITDVRVQRLQEISEEDAQAEGFGPRSARTLFRGTWGILNTKRGFGWDANCWVWALSFRRLP